MNRILTSIFLITGIFITQIHLHGQEQLLIRGRVTSTFDGLGLPGATVVELDKNNRVIKGSVTDIDGNFVLPISSRENNIQFSFIGLKSEIMKIGDQNSFNVQLVEDVKMIESVQVVAEKRTNTGFMEISDRNLAIPVQKISAADIQEVQASTIDEALQGRLAGVDIVSNSGDPGGGMSIRIRGVSTLSANNKPLIMIMTED